MIASGLNVLVRFVTVALVIVFAGHSTGFAQDTETAENDIVSTLKNIGAFTWLVDALHSTGLAESLVADGPYTIFAPTDEAVADLPLDTFASMSKEELVDLLRYHLLSDVVSQEEAASLGSLMTVQGGTITADADEDGVAVEGATIVTANIEAANGIIHGIDTVLMPPDAPSDPEGP